MDLPLHPSVDVYQIHRTPFFRRLHRKDSDEFERLKQAYESVRNFNEKPLEAQVKKIRLGKLLRRIKESFTNSKPNRPTKPRPRTKTVQEMRREELAKARQIGTEYSRQNLNGPQASVQVEKRNPQDEWQREKSRLERRLMYGNSKSQVNRNKIQRFMTLNSQRSEDYEAAQRYNMEQTHLSATRRRLIMLHKTLGRDEFVKFLVHCLSTENHDPELMKAFEEILRSKSDLYWDLVEALDQRQQCLKRSGKFIRKLSHLAIRGVPEIKNKKPQSTHEGSFVETFNSKTNIKPSARSNRRNKSPEVYIRTYRYSEEIEDLPLPSESLLKLTDGVETNTSIVATTPRDNPKAVEVQERPPLMMAASFQLAKKNSSSLSAKLMSTIRTDPLKKRTISQKFDYIIRDAVRHESALMLANLEKAMQH